MNLLDEHYFLSAVNGDTVRVFRGDRDGIPYLDDRHEVKPSRVAGAEVLRLSSLVEMLADSFEEIFHYRGGAASALEDE